MKMDPDKRTTTVGGKLPLRYLQEGHGFDTKGNYLGRFDKYGDPIKGGQSVVGGKDPGDPEGQLQETPVKPETDDEDLRAEYERVVGKKPGPRMKAKTMQAAIDEANAE